MFGLLQALDAAAALWTQEVLRCAAADAFFRVYTTLGNAGLLFIALCLLLLLRQETRRAGVIALCAMALGFLCTNVVLKQLIARPRPWVTLPQIIPLVHEGDPHSFPSGHTTAAFAAACAWQQTLPRRWMKIVGWALAALMALSRLYAGVHYLSDVMVGAAVGTLCGLAMRRSTDAAARHIS